MIWYQFIAFSGLAVCLSFAVFHFVKLLRLGKPKDLAKSIGNENDGILYSFTKAMSPKHKESAYLHLPTYTAGIVFHLAVFLSIALFFAFFTRLLPEGNYRYLPAILVLIGSASGIAILVKRILLAKMRALSNPDDYISNLLVSVFLLTTTFYLIYQEFEMYYYLSVSLLLFYFPLGKLRHAVYFFAARYHLGFFYGRRGVWPSKP